MYSYCYICSVLGIMFHCFVLCIFCVCMCTVLLSLGVNPIAVNKYIKYQSQKSPTETSPHSHKISLCETHVVFLSLRALY